MSIKVTNLERDSRKFTEQKGNFKVLEYMKDESVSPSNAASKYFMEKMNVRKKQLAIFLNNSSATLQAGAMQMMVGPIEARTGVKGVGDLVGKMFRGAVTNESAIKPEYQGTGLLLLEPTYKFLLLEDVSEWGPAGIAVEDGMFLACDSSVQHSLVSRSNFSSTVAGNEGLFNLVLSGNGIVALESNVPRNELVEITLENDVLKIDGNYAVCWSSNLQFSVERTTKSLVGSAASGEGLVNVYRGTGKVLVAPVTNSKSLAHATQI